MIGQKRLLKNIDKMVENGFPRFTILCGAVGSGKKLVAKHIAKQLNAQTVVSSTKVDDIRQVITLAYKQTEPTIYLISDADKMSPAAKNALLKITEEPPRKAYFIMTLIDINNTLATLKSRGLVLNMESYSSKDILDYVNYKKYELNSKEETIVCNLCTVPGEVDLLIQYDIEGFFEYTRKVVNNIGKVNGANAFKIGQQLKYKEEDTGWDIQLFMRALMFSYLSEVRPGQCILCKHSIQIISKYLSQLNVTGINKSATIDMMILELRGVWVED